MQENKTILYLLGAIIVVSIAFGTWKNTKPGSTGIENANSSASSTASVSPQPSGPSLKESVTTKAATQMQVDTNPNVKTVSYKGSSFEPAIIEINRGQEVLFVNKSGNAMRLVFNIPGATSQSYSVYDQVKTVGRDGTYQLVFNQPGIWNFYNLNGDKTVVGTLNVR